MRLEPALGVLVWAALLGATLAAQEATSVAVLHLADGTEIPLASWTLSYEYQTWKEGTSQALTQPVRREARELWSGKKAFPLAGAVLEIQYRLYDRPGEAGSEPAKAAAVTGLVLTAGGKKNEVKTEAPHKDFLVGTGGAKKMVVQPRALDLKGETLTGTKRDYCLLSYTPQVECSGAASERVVKIEFPK